MSLFATVQHIPYETSQACQQALVGVEAIDYFFARQIIHAQQTPRVTTLTSSEYAIVFHILIALSYFQRQGSVCISLSKIANQYFWLERSIYNSQDDLSETPSIDYSSEVSTSTGYCFGEQDELLQVLSKFMLRVPDLAYLILESDRLYSKRYWQYEFTLCQFIAQSLTESNLQEWGNQISAKQSLVNTKMQMLFSAPAVENSQPDLQQLAVLNTLYSPFSIITGGAGTGKTYTIARLAVLLCEVRDIPANGIEMAAPTGKAANRLAQSLHDELLNISDEPNLKAICHDLSKVEPKTLSRLLKINPANGLSAFNQQRPLPAKLVIVDEASMIDISLMNKLINSLADHSQLVLVGDPNQLPSVETGCLLADLVVHPIGPLSSQRWHLLRQVYPAFEDAEHYTKNITIDSQSQAKNVVNTLTRMRRSSNEVATFAEAILASDSEKALKLAGLKATDSKKSASRSNDEEHKAKESHQLSFEATEPAIQVKPFGAKIVNAKRELETVLNQDIIGNFAALFEAKSVEQAFAAMKTYALLTPFRKSVYGTHSLNQLIEQSLSRRYDWIEPNKLYRCKPIMILQNDYQLSLFNGDLGLIWENDSGQKSAYFKTAKGLTNYPIYNLPAFDVNYSMTIHKTQGSEFEAVDIIIPSFENDFLNKQLLYTGITRAQQRVRLFTNADTLVQVIKRSADRVSGIDSNLSAAIERVK